MNQLMEYIKKLNAGIADAATKEKAVKLRKILLIAGGTGVAVGIIGVLTCFILAATAGFGAFGPNGFTARFIVPLCLFPIFGIIAGISSSVLHAGLTVLIGGETAKFTDKITSKRCECGDVIADNELFCDKCGRKVRTKCPDCGEINDVGAKFCIRCGKKLDE